MNAPEKATGIYVLKAPRADAAVSRKKATVSLLRSMQRARIAPGGKSGRAYLKELRAARPRS